MFKARIPAAVIAMCALSIALTGVPAQAAAPDPTTVAAGTAATVINTGGPLISVEGLDAEVTDTKTGAVLANVGVNFTTPSGRDLCFAETNQYGNAECNTGELDLQTAVEVLLGGRFEAVFAGSPGHLAVTSSGPIDVALP